MKKLLTSYTFDASAQTVVSADFTTLEKIQLITNVTDNIIIYNFADATKGGALSGTTLTLDYDTTLMDDADKLQIFVEDAAAIQPVSGTVTANAGTGTLAVSLASVPSHAVTNAGTFAVQNTAALPAGTNNIGDVDVLTLPVAFNTGVRSATTQRVTIATDDSVPVTGTFWQATQPVSLASVPSHAVTNAGTFAVQNTAALPAGTNNIGDVDVLTLPALPAGNNNIGDVDIASMPAITGTVTANAGTNLNTSALALDATLTGGTVRAIPRGAAKGSTTAGDVTSTAASADRQLLDVTLRDTSGAPVTVGGAQYTEGDIDASVTGNALMWEDASDTLRVASAARPLPITAATAEALIDQLAHLNNNLRFLAGVQGIAADLRVTLLSGTVTTVTTVTTLTGQTNIGGFGAQHTIMNQMNTNANQLRQQIITS